MLTNKVKAQLLFLLTFLLGIVVGVTGLRLYESRYGRVASSDLTLLSDLNSTLDLSDKQMSEIENILNHSRQEYQELRNQNRPMFHAVRDRARLRIKEVLNEEQRRRYDEWNRERDEKREAQRNR